MCTMMRHGTCSAPAVQEELQYFTTARDLYIRYNVTGILAIGDILISNDHLQEELSSRTKAMLCQGFEGELSFVLGKVSLVFIFICMNTTLLLKD